MERDSFVFYRSFYEAIRRQPKKVQADIYNTIADYALNGTEPTQASDAVLSIFLLIKPQIDANNHRYTAGKKGGRPSKTDSNKKEEKTKTVDSEKEGKTETYGFEKEEKTETYGFENRAEKDAFEKPNENVNVNENGNENGNENEKTKTITGIHSGGCLPQALSFLPCGKSDFGQAEEGNPCKVEQRLHAYGFRAGIYKGGAQQVFTRRK